MHKLFKKALSLITTGICILSVKGVTSVLPVSRVYAADYYIHDTVDGYYYECWNNNETGELKFENTDNHGFEMKWNEIENAFGFKGEKFDREKIYAGQIKDYNLTYDADIDFMEKNNLIGVGGWMENPTIEFYIIDGWGNWNPHSDDVLSTFESNGIKYNVYKVFTNKQTPDGKQIFAYNSVAQENIVSKIDDTCNVKNTINVADHFKAWCEAGLELGYIYDIGFQIHAFRSSGSAKLNSLEISKDITDDINYGPNFTHKPHDPLLADEKGRTIYIDFESGNPNTVAVSGNPDVTYDTEHSSSGEKSMLIPCVGDSEQFFDYNIDPFDFNFNEAKQKELAAGMKIYHNGSQDILFKVELATTYKNHLGLKDICCRTISPGGWRNMDDIRFFLTNDRFTDCSLRIIPSEPVDFYVDDFYIADVNDYDNNKIHTCGDVNDDNIIDAYDIIALRKELIKGEEYYLCTDYDINGNCMLDLSDLVLLQKYVLGNIDFIPEPERETELEYGRFTKNLNGHNFDVFTYDLGTSDVKTAVRSDGTFMANWKGARLYEMSQNKKIIDFNEISVKYSGLVKTTPHKEYEYRKGVELSILGGFKRDVSDFLYICVYEGYKKRNIMPDGRYIEELETINIGDNTYYIDNETEKIDSDTITRINLYDIDTFNVCGESSDFEGYIDFTEIMKAIDIEGFEPQTVDLSFSSRMADGYVDFNEISFIDKSNANDQKAG